MPELVTDLWVLGYGKRIDWKLSLENVNVIRLVLLTQLSKASVKVIPLVNGTIYSSISSRRGGDLKLIREKQQK
jgi:hypothetical protein